MVSNASDDFPEPDRPVITTSLSRGISTSMFLRLCSRAPLMTIFFIAMGAGCGGRRPRAAVPMEPRCVARSDFQRVYPNTERAMVSSVPLTDARRDGSATGAGAGRRAGPEGDRRVDPATDDDGRLTVAPRDRILTIQTEEDEVQQSAAGGRDQQ